MVDKEEGECDEGDERKEKAKIKKIHVDNFGVKCGGSVSVTSLF